MARRRPKLPDPEAESLPPQVNPKPYRGLTVEVRKGLGFRVEGSWFKDPEAESAVHPELKVETLNPKR